jgi:hypothetical protein
MSRNERSRKVVDTVLPKSAGPAGSADAPPKGDTNDHGSKIKDKTNVKRNPKMAGKMRKPNSPTAKRLMGRRI